MRLLVTTQSIDREDPVLGFFHRWLEVFSSQFERIEVVCLKEGVHTLPSSVQVHSLGKEYGKGRSTYVRTFFGLIWSLRTSYDAVLVHMNPEYVILGACVWKLFGKKVFLWYNHPKGGFRLSLALFLADKVFYTSTYAAPAHSKKSVRMPVGIDTELFTQKGGPRIPHALYMQGRVALSKHVAEACAAVRLLRSEGTPVTLAVVGPEDAAYGARIRNEYKDLIEEGALSLLGPKRNDETPALYSVHVASLNLAGSGHYDKTVLESLACGTPVIVASDGFSGAPVIRAKDLSPEAIAASYRELPSSPDVAGLVRYVHEHHDLALLARRLREAIDPLAT
jgi:glycosyltransferase involved in cell wall biosynthesis